MLDYLKLYPQTIEMIKRYKEDQRCRLYEAMAAYAFTGQEPAWPEDAPEWLIWEALRQHVDRADQKVNQLRQNGKKNEAGQPRADGSGQNPAEASESEDTEAKESKPEQAESKESKPEQSEASASKQAIHNTKDITHKPEEEKENDEDTPKAPAEAAKPAARSAAGREDGSGFDDFWKAYPKKQDKQNALKAWKKLRPDAETLRKILGAVQAQRASPQWQKDAGQFIPLPSTWLNGRRWEDQPVTGVSSQGRTVSAQMYTQRDYTEEELNACGVDLIAEARAARQRKAAAG